MRNDGKRNEAFLAKGYNSIVLGAFWGKEYRASVFDKMTFCYDADRKLSHCVSNTEMRFAAIRKHVCRMRFPMSSGEMKISCTKGSPGHSSIIQGCFYYVY